VGGRGGYAAVAAGEHGGLQGCAEILAGMCLCACGALVRLELQLRAGVGAEESIVHRQDAFCLAGCMGD
jgi:hypothetical protein